MSDVNWLIFVHSSKFETLTRDYDLVISAFCVASLLFLLYFMLFRILMLIFGLSDDFLAITVYISSFFSAERELLGFWLVFFSC